MKINMKHMEKYALVGALFLAISVTTNRQSSNISSKLDTVISVSKKGKVDSLQQEIMELGWKLDSMTLKHDEGWKFTN